MWKTNNPSRQWACGQYIGDENMRGSATVTFPPGQRVWVEVNPERHVNGRLRQHRMINPEVSVMK